MLHSAVLLNIAFRATVLTALLVVASGSLPAVSDEGTVSVSKCDFTFEVVYPEDKEKDPYPICISHCPAENEIWFHGVAYKEFCELNRYSLMIEAVFRNGELQSCKMVPLLTGEELKTRQAAFHKTLDACLANKSEKSTDSSVSELGPVPDELSGFTRVGDSFYLVSPMSLSWQDGVEFCDQYGQTLAVIESEEEQSQIQEVLRSDVWIGLSNATTDGTFTSSPLSQADYTNWDYDLPDNGNDCTMMVEQLDYRWVTSSCYLERRVLCEWLPRYSCPEDSHMFQTSACFHVSGPSVTGDYSRGIVYCASRGMTLASIHSQDEQTFVESLLPDFVWIGLDDQGREGDFRWIDGTPLDYKHFNTIQPDNYAQTEHCVEMHKGIGYEWNDWSCKHVIQFLCKSAVSVQ